MEAPAASQASSQHFPLEPLAASTLVAREVARRNEARALGPCRSGCAQLDDYVLMGGGLERGCVVGVSAEEEDAFGLVLGVQVLARALLDDAEATALVVTPRPRGVLLRALRDGVAAELRARSVGAAAETARACLERVMVSCVFDLDGLWEVLADLDEPGGSSPAATGASAAAAATDAADGDEAAAGLQAQSPVSEIQDSQDEASTPSPPASAAAAAAAASPRPGAATRRPAPPSVILVTHFSALLTSLFTQRENAAAHAALQLLGAHLRYLSRSLASHPLVLLLNSTATTSSADSSAADANSHAHQRAANAPRAKQPLDATLRSVFHPAPLPLPGYAPPPAALLRANKPSFGLVFSQLLDLHLLCTRVPRGKDDADGVYGSGAAGAGRPHEATAATAVRYVTVVEVLLDDMGLWQGRTGHRPRREQRWAAVDLVGGRVVDGFARAERVYPELRLSAGFGGRRP